MTYLDYAATTPVADEVATVIYDALTQNFANPSSTYQAGKNNKFLINQARQKLVKLLNFDKGQIYFTSGATEANNWAIVAQAMMARELGYGNHIVSTSIEHPSVLQVLKHLEAEGFEVTYLNPINQNFEVDSFIRATKKNTTGWVSMLVNNEVGSRLPIEELGLLAPKYVQWFHVDAVQGFGQGIIDFNQLNATSYSISGHKLYAPKGIGILAYRAWNDKMRLTPLIHGGGQEFGLRSGTENLPYIIGLMKAFELAQMKSKESSAVLEQYLLEELTKNKIKFERNGSNQVSYIVNLYFYDLVASQLLIQTDLAGIAISAGSACSAGSLEVSHVLKAYYPEDHLRHHQSIRISFGNKTTKEEIDLLVKEILQLKERTEKLWHLQKNQH